MSMDRKSLKAVLTRFGPSIALLLLLVFEFWALLKSPMPIWDDFHFIFNSSRFTEAHSFLDFFSLGARPEDQRAWPLTYTVLWFMYQVFHENFFYYKLLSIVIHGINGALLFHLLKRSNYWLALVVTAIFVLNPIQIETVAWILQLGSLAATTFLLLALMGFEQVYARDFKVDRRFFLSAAAFLISLLFKISAVLFPLFAFLFVLLNDRKKLVHKNFLLWLLIVTAFSSWRGWVTIKGSRAVPFESTISDVYQKSNLSVGNVMTAAVVPSVPVMRPVGAVKSVTSVEPVATEQPATSADLPEISSPEPAETSLSDFYAQGAQQGKDLLEKLNLAVGSLVAYLGIFFGLKGNLFFYPKNHFHDNSYILFCYGVVLAVLGFFAWRVRSRATILSALFALLLFVPISGLFYVPYMKYSFIADHWFYTASVFLCVTLFHLAQESKVRVWAMYLLILFCVKGLYDSKIYADYFSDQKKLLTYNLEKNDELEILKMMLAEEYVRENNFQEAYSVLEKGQSTGSFDLENMKLFVLMKLGKEALASNLLVELAKRSRDEGHEDLSLAYLKVLLQKYPKHPELQQLLNGVYNQIK